MFLSLWMHLHPGVQRRVSLQPPEMLDLKVLVVSPKRNVSILFTVEFPNLVPEFHDSLQLIVFSSHLTEPAILAQSSRQQMVCRIDYVEVQRTIISDIA